MVNIYSIKRLFLCLCLVSVLVYFALQWNFVCSNRDTQTLLLNLCDDVESGKAIGSLCKEFCSGALSSHNCLAFHRGKEVVFSAQFHGNTVYVKGRKSDIFANQEENLFWKDQNGIEHFPSISEFKSIVKSHLLHNFNVSYSERVFYNLWKSPIKIESFSAAQNNLLQKLSLKTLWGLLQDPEFVTLSVFQHVDIFPELYGTCGGFYVVEELKHIQYPSFVPNTNFKTFVKNVKIAVGILDLLTVLDTSFGEPVYLCDVKKEHFGISDFGTIKVLDLDNVYLKSIIDRSIGENTHCDNHSDCDFFDCKGMCDLIRHKCFTGVTNNNLQNVCEKIFVGTLSGFDGYSNGLLSSSHSTSSLKNLLNECSNPSLAKDGTRTFADEFVKQKLKLTLKEIVAADSKLMKDIL